MEEKVGQKVRDAGLNDTQCCTAAQNNKYLNYERMTTGDGRWRHVACLGRLGGVDGVLRTDWGVRVSKCGTRDHAQRLTTRVWCTRRTLALRCSFDILKEGFAVL